MPPTEAATWWADVQQDREDLGGRREADVWLEEDVDFVPAPRRRFPRGQEGAVEPRRPRGEHAAAEPRPRAPRVMWDAEAEALFAEQDPGRAGADHALHGVFVHAESGPAHAAPAEPRQQELLDEARGITNAVRDLAQEAREQVTGAPKHERAANGRRTVHITGRPEQRSAPAPSAARRHRRPRTASERMGHRPDRIAMWAVLLGVVLILVAAFSANAQAATSLGDRTVKAGMQGRDVRQLQNHLRALGYLQAPATARFGALTKAALKRYQRSRCLKADGVAGPATIRAIKRHRRACRRGARAKSRERAVYRRVSLGARTLARGMAGRDVRTLQRLLGVTSTGTFGPITARAVKRFQRRAGLGVDGAVGPATTRALVDRRMRARRATFFGPGLYGRRTACGQRLTKGLVGVAHRKLPCGATVTLHLGGRFLTTRVVDRGPFTDGITFDLTAAAARRLGMSVTTTLRAAY